MQWHDEAKTARAVAAISPRDVDGFLAYDALFVRIRDRLRTGPRGDVWLGDAPDRAQLEDLFSDDAEALDVLLHASIADVVERHVHDERLRTALHGQGVIGTFAGPRDPGPRGSTPITVSVSSAAGRSWKAGSAGCRSCSPTPRADAGAVVAVDAPVAAINPGEGVVLDDGTTIGADVVVSNADPVRTLALLDAGGTRAPALEAMVAAGARPARSSRSTARSHGSRPSRPRAAIRRCTARRWRSRAASTRRKRRTRPPRGRPAPEWCELYFQTGTTRRSRHRDTTR